MKKISNDNSIVETVKKTNQYKIKTSANDILQAFEKENSESIAKGKTKVDDIKYILRGYEELDEKLNSLGANIKVLIQ